MRSTRNENRRKFCIAGMIVLLYFAPSRSYANNSERTEQFSKAVSDFSRLRALAYTQVLDLKAIYSNSKKQLGKSEAIYNKTKVAADTWLDTVRAALAFKNGLPDQAALKSATEELQKRIDDLVIYTDAARLAESPKEKTRISALLAAVAALITSLADVMSKAYTRWDNAEEQERSNNIKEIERLRWLPYSDIGK